MEGVLDILHLNFYNVNISSLEDLIYVVFHNLSSLSIHILPLVHVAHKFLTSGNPNAVISSGNLDDNMPLNLMANTLKLHHNSIVS